MSNIPGWHSTPGGDFAIKMTFEKSGGKLTTDDWGNEFEIEGNIRLIALAILEHALYWKEHGYSGISFSRFEFSFKNGIEVKSRWTSNDPEKMKKVLDLVGEIQKIIDLKAFL